jgi:RNAse (barnase) inhibitor barstar
VAAVKIDSGIAVIGGRSPMGERLLSVNIGSARTKAEVLDMLASELSFPDWWGKNWDACWDCMTDPQLSNLPSRLRVTGVRALREKLPKDAEILARILAELENARDDVAVSWD